MADLRRKQVTNKQERLTSSQYFTASHHVLPRGGFCFVLRKPMFSAISGPLTHFHRRPNEKGMPAPSYFAKVAAASHGRVSWQSHRTHFEMGQPARERSLLANNFGVRSWLIV